MCIRDRDTAERAVLRRGPGLPVQHEERVGEVVQRAVGEGEAGAVADPDGRVVAGAGVDLAGAGLRVGALVPDRERAPAEVPDGGLLQHEPGASAQVGGVLGEVVHPAAGEHELRLGVQGESVAGDAVDLAVGEPAAGLRLGLHPAAPDLVDLTAGQFGAAARVGEQHPGAARVVQLAALQPGGGAAEHRQPGLPGVQHLAVLDQRGGLRAQPQAQTGRVADGAAAQRRVAAFGDLDADGRAGLHPAAGQLDVRFGAGDQDGGDGALRALDHQVADDRGGDDGERHTGRRVDPYRPRALGGEDRHPLVEQQVLPERTGPDQHGVAGLGGREGLAERLVLAGAPTPPRGAVLRDPDPVLTHGDPSSPPSSSSSRSCTWPGAHRSARRPVLPVAQVLQRASRLSVPQDQVLRPTGGPAPGAGPPPGR